MQIKSLTKIGISETIFHSVDFDSTVGSGSFGKMIKLLFIFALVVCSSSHSKRDKDKSNESKEEKEHDISDVTITDMFSEDCSEFAQDLLRFLVKKEILDVQCGNRILKTFRKSFVQIKNKLIIILFSQISSVLTISKHPTAPNRWQQTLSKNWSSKAKPMHAENSKTLWDHLLADRRKTANDWSKYFWNWFWTIS